jgi:hypothetical protein
MTTVTPFLPSNLFTPKFGATFDGADYNVSITWNISAQRYYVNIYGLDGIWVVTVPLIQTPPARAVASLLYDNLRRVVTVQLSDPSTWPVPLSKAGLLTPPGTIVDYTLENFDPAVLNATWRSLHIDPITFSFRLEDDPGGINIIGSVSRYLNMVGGIFQTSTLIYRNGAFEINP